MLPLFPEEEEPGLVGVWVLLLLLPAGLLRSSGTSSGDSVTAFWLCQDSMGFSENAELCRGDVL